MPVCGVVRRRSTDIGRLTRVFRSILGSIDRFAAGGEVLFDEESWLEHDFVRDLLAVSPRAQRVRDPGARIDGLPARERVPVRILEADDVVAGREKVDLDVPQKTCVILPSNEISRARGGPHCLTHGLVRDRVD